MIERHERIRFNESWQLSTVWQILRKKFNFAVIKSMGDLWNYKLHVDTYFRMCASDIITMRPFIAVFLDFKVLKPLASRNARLLKQLSHESVERFTQYGEELIRPMEILKVCYIVIAICYSLNAIQKVTVDSKHE